MTVSKPALQSITTDVDVLLDSGFPVHVEGVEGAKDPKSGSVYIDPVGALRAYYEKMARAVGLSELRDASLLSMLTAPIGGIEVPWVLRKYSLNKMLFYQLKRAEANGLGSAFPHDNFVAERKGPVPENIDSDLDRLESAGLIVIRRHDPTQVQHQPWVIELTEQGRAVGRRFFDSTETWFRRATIETKKEILPLNPAKLKARVHSDFPKLRRKYIEVDDS